MQIAMANSNSIDRLSSLPDELLLTMISFLPTHIAARTSILCRRFRHLWEASPSLALISRDLPHPQSDHKFVSMAKCALLRRNPSHPLLSLRLEVSRTTTKVREMVSSFLAKARSLDLRHLTIHKYLIHDFLLILPIIFTITSLRCLSLDLDGIFYFGKVLKFPSGINLTCLRSLSLRLVSVYLADLNPLLSELCSLADLYLHIGDTPGLSLFSQTIRTPGLSLFSQTIRKLKLIITGRTQKLDIVRLSLPSLESLHLEIQYSLENPSHIHAEAPLLRKAMINVHDIHERNVSTVAGLLNCISHVEELSLRIKEREFEKKYPTPVLLESEKDVPKFSNLKHLDVTLCFHKYNFEAITKILHNCPALRSLKLVHEDIFMPFGRARGKKKKDWESKLPCNADGNNHYAFFKNLHLGEDKKVYMKLLRKKCTRKRQNLAAKLA